VTEVTFDDAKDFHEGLAQVKVGIYGAISISPAGWPFRRNSRWPVVSLKVLLQRIVQAISGDTSIAPALWSSGNSSALHGLFRMGWLESRLEMAGDY